jgi:hypothetical protein
MDQAGVDGFPYRCDTVRNLKCLDISYQTQFLLFLCTKYEKLRCYGEAVFICFHKFAHLFHVLNYTPHFGENLSKGSMVNLMLVLMGLCFS